MKRAAKIFGYALLGIAVLLAALLTYVKTALPDTGPPPELTVQITPERVARGEYLANHVTVCMDCHSARDMSAFSGPMVAGTLGQGGELFDEKLGFPGKFYSRNITPTGLKDWTDGEIYRAITTGVSRDGHALFPIMPYPYYSRMDPEDIHCLIAYLRTLKPIDHAVPASEASFPFNFILNTIPAKASPSTRPNPQDALAYGGYLANAAGCKECHTQAENGQILEEKAFSGGRNFQLPTGVLYSANITPDVETGIGKWTKEAFIARFKAYADSSYHAPKVTGFQTIMPWTMYGGMSDQDLGSIYVYLKSLKPARNAVKVFVPGT